ncbi:hypothetical protein [Streptacidiphilus sp. MAP12-20]|uniref:hypothetical protein n=1 Tax=Streptacidiphilus sp. MAP12-20 TaxID=3156299 RepID=UPI0035156250
MHSDAEGGPVLGLFVSVSGLAEAEEAVAKLCARAIGECPALAAFSILTCGAVLVPGPWWDGG